MNTAIRSLFLCALVSTAALASEGDLLVDVGPVTHFSSDEETANPAIGGSASVLWGFNDQTDLGIFYRGAHAYGADGYEDKYVQSLGLSSWYTPFAGDIRPQFGGQFGFGGSDGSGFVHLAAQARGLIEVKTNVRFYVGGTAGAMFGEHGSTFATADFGMQLMF